MQFFHIALKLIQELFVLKKHFTALLRKKNNFYLKLIKLVWDFPLNTGWCFFIHFLENNLQSYIGCKFFSLKISPFFRKHFFFFFSSMKSTFVDFCVQVELDRGRPVSIRHRLEVLLPPSIRSEPADGQVQKRFIYRNLTRHDFLPVWLVADKKLAWRQKILYRTDCGTAHPVLLNPLSKVTTSCSLVHQIFVY